MLCISNSNPMVETKNNSSQVGSAIINSFGKYQLKFYFLTRYLYQDCPILVNLLLLRNVQLAPNKQSF